MMRTSPLFLPTIESRPDITIVCLPLKLFSRSLTQSNLSPLSLLSLSSLSPLSLLSLSSRSLSPSLLLLFDRRESNKPIERGDFFGREEEKERGRMGGVWPPWNCGHFPAMVQMYHGSESSLCFVVGKHIFCGGKNHATLWEIEVIRNKVRFL